MRKTFVLLLVLGLMIWVVACSEGTSDDRVSMYTHNDEGEMTDFLDDLKDATDLELDVLTASGGILWSRIESEFPDVEADLQWGSLHLSLIHI